MRDDFALGAREALLGLLVHLRAESPERALDELLEEVATPQHLLEAARSLGFSARLTMVDEEDLMHHNGPYLLELSAGGWALVLQRRNLRIRLMVEEDGGTRLLPLRQVIEASTGQIVLVEQPLRVGPLRELIWQHARSLRSPVLQFLASASLSNLLALLGPWLIRSLVDQAIPRGDEALLTLLTLAVFLATTFRSLTYVLRERMILAVTAGFEMVVEKGLLERILWLPFRQLQRRSVAEFLQTFGSLGNLADWWVTQNAATAIVDGLQSVFFLLAMVVTFPGATGLVVLITLAACGSALLLSRAIAKLHKELVRRQARQRGFLVEMLNGIQTLKAMGSTEWAEERWRHLYNQERSVGLQKERLGLWSDLMLDLSLQVSLGAVLVWGGYFTLNGLAELGSLLGYIQIAGLFMRAQLALTRHLRILLGSVPEIRQVDQILTLEPEPRPSRGPLELPGPVVLDDVWFRYSPESPWVLRGVNLTVEPGRFKLLLAPSGFGKSTLMKVLAGLYTPESGRISLGGVDAKVAADFMMYLPQHTQLFSGTLAENLAFFSGEASEERLRQAASDTGLADWVAGLPARYQTPIVQGATNLSGGQRQLVLLTAVLASRKTLLFMDETMASLDWVARNRILRSPLFQNRTVIYSSHEDPEGWKDVSMLCDLESG